MSAATATAAAPATTAIANDAWEAMLTAHATLMRRFTSADTWHGVSPREYDVLYTLAKAGEPLRLCDLTERVLLSQPALSRLVERLVERGLVGRCHQPDDRRAAAISLTDEGRALQRTVGRDHGRDVAAVVSAALTVDEMRELERLAFKLDAATKVG